MIRAENITKAFGSRPILSDVSVSANAGVLFAVVGPSGCGKSTQLMTLGGLLRPDGGFVTLDGQRASMRELQAVTTWIPQAANCLPWRSVLDNVAVGGLAAGLGRGAARLSARQALDDLRIGHLASEPAKLVSGGELQRVAIARSLCSRRPIILADEPTGNLDSASTKQVLSALATAAERGACVVVATHDDAVFEIAGDVCDLT